MKGSNGQALSNRQTSTPFPYPNQDIGSLPSLPSAWSVINPEHPLTDAPELPEDLTLNRLSPYLELKKIHSFTVRLTGRTTVFCLLFYRPKWNTGSKKLIVSYKYFLLLLWEPKTRYQEGFICEVTSMWCSGHRNEIWELKYQNTYDLMWSITSKQITCKQWNKTSGKISKKMCIQGIVSTVTSMEFDSWKQILCNSQISYTAGVCKAFKSPE